MLRKDTTIMVGKMLSEHGHDNAYFRPGRSLILRDAIITVENGIIVVETVLPHTPFDVPLSDPDAIERICKFLDWLKCVRHCT